MSGNAQRYTHGHLGRGCWHLVRKGCPEGSSDIWCRPPICPGQYNRRGDIIGSSVSLHMCNTGSRCLAWSVSGTAHRYTPGHLERGCWRLVRTRCPEGSRATWCRPHSCPGRWTGNKVWSGAAAHCTLCHPHVPTAAGQHEVAVPHMLSCDRCRTTCQPKTQIR